MQPPRGTRPEALSAPRCGRVGDDGRRGRDVAGARSRGRDGRCGRPAAARAAAVGRARQGHGVAGVVGVELISRLSRIAQIAGWKTACLAQNYHNRAHVRPCGSHCAHRIRNGPRDEKNAGISVLEAWTSRTVGSGCSIPNPGDIQPRQLVREIFDDFAGQHILAPSLLMFPNTRTSNKSVGTS
jgi:hypothetical protein